MIHSGFGGAGDNAGSGVFGRGYGHGEGTVQKTFLRAMNRPERFWYWTYRP